MKVIFRFFFFTLLSSFQVLLSSFLCVHTHTGQLKLHRQLIQVIRLVFQNTVHLIPHPLITSLPASEHDRLPSLSVSFRVMVTVSQLTLINFLLLYAARSSRQRRLHSIRTGDIQISCFIVKQYFLSISLVLFGFFWQLRLIIILKFHVLALQLRQGHACQTKWKQLLYSVFLFLLLLFMIILWYQIHIRNHKETKLHKRHFLNKKDDSNINFKSNIPQWIQSLDTEFLYCKASILVAGNIIG